MIFRVHCCNCTHISRAEKLPLVFSFNSIIVILSRQYSGIDGASIRRNQYSPVAVVVVSQPNQITSVEIVLILPSCVSILTNR